MAYPPSPPYSEQALWRDSRLGRYGFGNLFYLAVLGFIGVVSGALFFYAGALLPGFPFQAAMGLISAVFLFFFVDLFLVFFVASPLAVFPSGLLMGRDRFLYSFREYAVKEDAFLRWSQIRSASLHLRSLYIGSVSRLYVPFLRVVAVDGTLFTKRIADYNAFQKTAVPMLMERLRRFSPVPKSGSFGRVLWSSPGVTTKVVKRFPVGDYDGLRAELLRQGLSPAKVESFLREVKAAGAGKPAKRVFLLQRSERRAVPFRDRKELVRFLRERLPPAQAQKAVDALSKAGAGAGEGKDALRVGGVEVFIGKGKGKEGDELLKRG